MQDNPNQPKSPVMAQFAKEHNVPGLFVVSNLNHSPNPNGIFSLNMRGTILIFSPIAPVVEMVETACICSKYDAWGNEL